MRYLKPHGALYHRVVDDEEQAARRARRLRATCRCSGMPGALVLSLAAEAGRAVRRSEGFPDRGYGEDGRLLPRDRAGRGAGRRREYRRTARWTWRPVVDSVCVHGDTPGAVGTRARSGPRSRPPGTTSARSPEPPGARLCPWRCCRSASTRCSSRSTTPAPRCPSRSGPATVRSPRTRWSRPRGPCSSTACRTRAALVRSPRGLAAGTPGRPRRTWSRSRSVYDGADLDEVARRVGLIRRRGRPPRTRAPSSSWRFCGFAPGFAYLRGPAGGVGGAAARPTPRTRVPAGSVGLAGHLVRRLPDRVTRRLAAARPHRRRLWDVTREPARAAAAGHPREVRGRDEPLDGRSTPARSPPSRTVAGSGYAHLGVPRGGCPGRAGRRAGQPAGRQPARRGRPRDHARRAPRSASTGR